MGSTLSCEKLHSSVKKGALDNLNDKLHHKPTLFSSVPLVSSHKGTVLHAACENKQVEVVRQLLSFLSSAPLPTVLEALQPYCRRAGLAPPASHQEAVRMAVDMTNAKGQTPLMYACHANCPELVQLLLQQGADPWLGDRCGCRTALHYAALAGHAACVEALLGECGDAERGGTRYINVRSVCGLTPLHYATFFGNLEAVTALLAHNPLITAATTCESYELSGCVTCDSGSTPLHFAAVRGQTDIVRELLTFHARRMHGGATQDPRLRKDAAQMLPWQVACLHHPRALQLARLLHPGHGVLRVLGMQPADAAGGEWRLGPASLAAIAASALRGRLLAQLEAVTRGTQADADQQQLGSLDEQQQLGSQDEQQQRAHAGFNEGSHHGAAAHKAQGAYGEQVAGLCRPSCSAEGLREASCTASEAGCGGRDKGEPSCRSGCCGDSVAGQPDCSVAGRAAPAGAGAGAVVSAPAAHGKQAAAAADDDDGDDEGVCDVCFSARVAVAPSGCRHGLCGGCAAQMARGVARKPLLCPFCRQVVSGFVAVTTEAH